MRPLSRSRGWVTKRMAGLLVLTLLAGCAQLAALDNPAGGRQPAASADERHASLRVEAVGLEAPLPPGGRVAPRDAAQPQLLLRLLLEHGVEARVEVWPAPPEGALDDPAWVGREKASLRALLPGLEGLGQTRPNISGQPALALDYAWQGVWARRVYLATPRGLVVASLAGPSPQAMDRAAPWLAGLRLDPPPAPPEPPADPAPPATTAKPQSPPPLDQRGKLYSLDPPTLERLSNELASQEQNQKDARALVLRIEVAAWLTLARRGLGLAEPERDWSRLRARAVSAWRRLPREAASHRALGLAMLLEDRLAKAHHYLERAAELEPGDAANWLAWCQLPDLESARRLELAEKALSLAPGLPAAPLSVANALGELKRPSEAEATYGQALSLQPDNLAGLMGLARLEMDQPASLEAAGRHLARAAELEPDLEAARFNLALVRLRQGQAAEALALAESLSLAHPQDSAILNLRGTILLRLDRPAQARQDFQAATQAGPDHAQAYYNLGGVCVSHFQDAACARAAFQRFLELEPEGARADKARAWLIRQGGGN